MHFPPLPELPPFLSGRSVVVIDGAYAGGADEGAAAIAALRALEPEMDTFAPSSPAVLSRIHMDPEEPIPYRGDGAVLGTLDAAALDAFAAAHPAGRRRCCSASCGTSAARSAASRPAAAPRAASAASTCCSPSGWRCRRRWPPARPPAQAALSAAMAPWATGKEYLNFVEHAADPATLYGDDDYARLRAIRAAVDPAGRMVGNHPIPAAA